MSLVTATAGPHSDEAAVRGWAARSVDGASAEKVWGEVRAAFGADARGVVRALAVVSLCARVVPPLFSVAERAWSLRALSALVREFPLPELSPCVQQIVDVVRDVFGAGHCEDDEEEAGVASALVRLSKALASVLEQNSRVGVEAMRVLVGAVRTDACPRSSRCTALAVVDCFVSTNDAEYAEEVKLLVDEELAKLEDQEDPRWCASLLKLSFCCGWQESYCADDVRMARFLRAYRCASRKGTSSHVDEAAAAFRYLSGVCAARGLYGTVISLSRVLSDVCRDIGVPLGNRECCLALLAELLSVIPQTHLETCAAETVANLMGLVADIPDDPLWYDFASDEEEFDVVGAASTLDVFADTKFSRFPLRDHLLSFIDKWQNSSRWQERVAAITAAAHCISMSAVNSREHQGMAERMAAVFSALNSVLLADPVARVRQNAVFCAKVLLVDSPESQVGRYDNTIRDVLKSLETLAGRDEEHWEVRAAALSVLLLTAGIDSSGVSLLQVRPSITALGVDSVNVGNGDLCVVCLRCLGVCAHVLGAQFPSDVVTLTTLLFSMKDIRSEWAHAFRELVPVFGLSLSPAIPTLVPTFLSFLSTSVEGEHQTVLGVSESELIEAHQLQVAAFEAVRELFEAGFSHHLLPLYPQIQDACVRILNWTSPGDAPLRGCAATILVQLAVSAPSEDLFDLTFPRALYWVRFCPDVEVVTTFVTFLSALLRRFAKRLAASEAFTVVETLCLSVTSALDDLSACFCVADITRLERPLLVNALDCMILLRCDLHMPDDSVIMIPLAKRLLASESPWTTRREAGLRLSHLLICLLEGRKPSLVAFVLEVLPLIRHAFVDATMDSESPGLALPFCREVKRRLKSEFAPVAPAIMEILLAIAERTGHSGKGSEKSLLAVRIAGKILLSWADQLSLPTLLSRWLRLVSDLPAPSQPVCTEIHSCLIDFLIRRPQHQHLVTAGRSLYHLRRALMAASSTKSGLTIEQTKLAKSLLEDLGVQGDDPPTTKKQKRTD